MNIYTKEEILENKEEIIKSIKEGAVFIYPTDTIYGIGCDATNENSVNKIRKLKNRDSKPLSVIAPSKDWIRKNFTVDDHCEEWLEKLPGPYTLIINTERGLFISEVQDCVNPGGNSIGIRIPKHWISELVKDNGLPIVTTSVNISGNSYMTCIENLDDLFRKEVDFIIDEGKIDGKPSEKIVLSDEGDVTRDNVSDM